MKTLPEDFIKYTQKLMGEELFLQLKQGITEGEAPTSIRLNPFKCKEGEDAPGEPIHAAHSFSKVHAAFAGLVDGSVTASMPVSGS